MDTCGAAGSVALARDGDVVCLKAMPERRASKELLRLVDAALAEVGWSKADLEAVGVTSGPGSFTGVRVGLAAAKGIAEALGLPMAAVSRLAVLREAADGGLVALDAGRGEAFVLGEDGVERVAPVNELNDVVVCEEGLAAKIAGARLVAIDAASAVGEVLRKLAAGGSDVALSDANYVRGEAQMYRQAGV